MAQSDLRLTGGVEPRNETARLRGGPHVRQSRGRYLSRDDLPRKPAPSSSRKSSFPATAGLCLTCVTSLQRALPPEGRRMSTVQPLLPLPRPSRARVRNLRRPFTPSRTAGPYRLPHDAWDRLVSALAPARNRDAALALAVFLGRFWSTPNRLVSAFPIDRRALANRLDLGLTEAQVRGAVRALENVGFLDRALPEKGSAYRAVGPAGELHRKPVLFRFGGEYAPLFVAANNRAAAARGGQGRSRRQISPVPVSRPSVARGTAPSLKSPKSKSKAENKVLMGEVAIQLPKSHLQKSALDSALERWTKAFEESRRR